MQESCTNNHLPAVSIMSFYCTSKKTTYIQEFVVAAIINA